MPGHPGFGEADPAQYVTVLAPRRLAWLNGGSGSTNLQQAPNLPGTVLASSGVPLNQGAGTNEDIALVAERSNVLLLGGAAQVRVFPEIGSSTLTARVLVPGDVVLLVKNPKGVCKVTGLTPPSGFLVEREVNGVGNEAVTSTATRSSW